TSNRDRPHLRRTTAPWPTRGPPRRRPRCRSDIELGRSWLAKPLEPRGVNEFAHGDALGVANLDPVTEISVLLGDPPCRDRSRASRPSPSRRSPPPPFMPRKRPSCARPSAM